VQRLKVRTRGGRRVTERGAVRPVSSTGASGRYEKTPSEGATAIFICGVINRSGGRPWLVLDTLGT
jgi:hypothetical protein